MSFYKCVVFRIPHKWSRQGLSVYSRGRWRLERCMQAFSVLQIGTLLGHVFSYTRVKEFPPSEQDILYISC
jgi:hypothetical protein